MYNYYIDKKKIEDLNKKRRDFKSEEKLKIKRKGTNLLNNF